MPDKPPKKEEKQFEIGEPGSFLGEEPQKEDPEELARIQQLLAASIEDTKTYDLSGRKTEPNTPQEGIKEEKLIETVSENFKKLVDIHVTWRLMAVMWTQTTRGLTNNPYEKETERFLKYTIDKAKNILMKFFKEFPIRDVHRKYIMDELYKKLKEQNLAEPFKKVLEKFFMEVFYGLPTGFNTDEK